MTGLATYNAEPPTPGPAVNNARGSGEISESPTTESAKNLGLLNHSLPRRRSSWGRSTPTARHCLRNYGSFERPAGCKMDKARASVKAQTAEGSTSAFAFSPHFAALHSVRQAMAAATLMNAGEISTRTSCTAMRSSRFTVKTIQSPTASEWKVSHYALHHSRRGDDSAPYWVASSIKDSLENLWHGGYRAGISSTTTGLKWMGWCGMPLSRSSRPRHRQEDVDAGRSDKAGPGAFGPSSIRGPSNHSVQLSSGRGLCEPSALDPIPLQGFSFHLVSDLTVQPGGPRRGMQHLNRTDFRRTPPIPNQVFAPTHSHIKQMYWPFWRKNPRSNRA